MLDRHHEELVERFQRVFREDGLGDVGGRVAVLREFLGTQEHVLAEDIRSRLVGRGVPLETDDVEAALESFVIYGLAAKREFEGQPPRYEHLHPGHHHDHIICVRCGKIQEVADSRLEDLQDHVVRLRGFRPLAHRLEIYGLCGDCDAKPDHLLPLSALPEGARGRVGTLTGGRGLQARLISMGLNPGSEVEVISNSGPGPFIVASRGTRIALGFGLARRVLVTPIEERPEGGAHGRDLGER